MTCNEAREMMLVADPAELSEVQGTDIATHLRACASCAHLARAIGADLAVLNGTVRRRARWRVTKIALAATVPIAAGVFAIVGSRHRQATPVELRSPSTASVSVDVPPGQQAAVFKTRDPKVTIVWMTSESGL